MGEGVTEPPRNRIDMADALAAKPDLIPTKVGPGPSPLQRETTHVHLRAVHSRLEDFSRVACCHFRNHSSDFVSSLGSPSWPSL